MFNHSFLEVVASDDDSWVLSGGPQYYATIVWRTIREHIKGIGWVIRKIAVPEVGAMLVTENSDTGMYNESASGLEWFSAEPCGMVDTLMTENSEISGKYDYKALDQDCNSLIASLLYSVGLLGSVPQPPMTQGWSNHSLTP